MPLGGCPWRKTACANDLGRTASGGIEDRGKEPGVPMGECPWETVARKEVSLGKGGTRMGDARWEKVRLVVVRDNKLVMQRVLEKGKNKYGQNKNPCMPPCQTRKKSMPNSCLRLLLPE